MGSAFFFEILRWFWIIFWRFSLLVLSLHSRGCFEDIPSNEKMSILNPSLLAKLKGLVRLLKSAPCSFENLLSGNRPHLVHRVLQVRVAALLLVRDRAKNVNLNYVDCKRCQMYFEEDGCLTKDVRFCCLTCSGFLKTTFLTWALPSGFT